MIIFDLDGTISDPLEGIAASVNHALIHHGQEPVSEQRVAAFIGPPLEKMLTTFSGVRQKRELASYIARYRDHYGKEGYARNRLYPGMIPLLRDLKKQGLALGLCTSKRSDFAARILELFQIEHLFEFVNGGDIGVSKTEQLAGLLETGQIGRDAIMIGDRAVDLEAAQRNGLPGIGVLWGYGSREELSAWGPILIASTPEEILHHLTSSRPHCRNDS